MIIERTVRQRIDKSLFLCFLDSYREPNHVHFIWEQLKKNGKETPQGSFLKYTTNEFLKKLKQNGLSKLYEVNAANKKHEIWQRDSLSIEIFSEKFAIQKLYRM